MKNRELLEMDDLGVTDEIREIAYQDQRGKENSFILLGGNVQYLL